MAEPTNPEHPKLTNPDAKMHDGKTVDQHSSQFTEFLKTHKGAVIGAIIGVITVGVVLYLSSKQQAQPSAGTGANTGYGNPVDTSGLTGGTLGGGTYGDGGTTGTTGTTGDTGTTTTPAPTTTPATTPALPPQISNLPPNLQSVWQSFSMPSDNPAAWTAQQVNPGGNAQREYQGCVRNCHSSSIHCKGKKRGSSECTLQPHF